MRPHPTSRPPAGRPASGGPPTRAPHIEPAQAERIWPGGVPASWQRLMVEPGPTPRERAAGAMSRTVALLAMGLPAGGALLAATLSATGETLQVLGHVASVAPLGPTGRVIALAGLALALGRLGWHLRRMARRRGLPEAADRPVAPPPPPAATWSTATQPGSWAVPGRSVWGTGPPEAGRPTPQRSAEWSSRSSSNRAR